MSQRSILSASVQASFPDNTSGFITPNGLRNEQGLFVSYSVLNEQTASIIAQAVATASVGGGNVTTSSFNAYTASTNTFTSSIQTQVNTLQSVTSSYVQNSQTSSFVNNSQTSSFVRNNQTSSMSVASASFATTASYAANANFNTGSLATTGSNSFSGSNTFSGSVFIQTASISVLYADKIVSSSTIFSSGSNTLGDASDDTQTLWGTVDIKTGPLQVSGSANISGSLVVNGSSPVLSNQTSSFVTSAITGSSLITASVSLNTITFTEGDGTTFNITVNTGSAGGMNLGANVFTGSQTLSSSTTPASLIMNVSGGLVSLVTESNATNTGYGNIIFNQRIQSAQSGSTIISGSGNIIFEAGTSAISPKGISGNNNIGQAIIYSGSIPNSTANILSVAFVSSGSRNTISNNYGLQAATFNNNNNSSGSFSSNIVVGAVQVNTNYSASGINVSQTVQNGFFGTTLVDIAGSGSTSARSFQNNLFGGNANTASLTTATGSINQSGSLYNTIVYGNGLVVSGTQIPTQTLHGGAFFGRFNETGSLASSKDIVFAIGGGTSTTARKTLFYVSASSDVVIRPGGDNYGINIFQRSKAVINDGYIGGYTSSLTAAQTATAVGCINAVFNGSTEGSIGVGAIDTTITGGTSTTAVGTNNVTITTTNPKRLNTMLGVFTATISGSDVCSMIASNDSFIANSLNSVILGGVNVRLNNTTGSVALDRDAAYTGSASYTLYTQNINASGSVSITGSILVTGDVKFASGSNKTMGTVALDGGNPGSATISNTLVTTSSLIFLTKQTNNHPNAGPVVVSSKGSGTFTITSNHNSDTDIVAYQIINPA